MAHTRMTTDELVTDFVAWAADQGVDPDTVDALKSFQRSGGATRREADAIADMLYIGGGESNWRSND